MNPLLGQLLPGIFLSFLLLSGCQDPNKWRETSQDPAFIHRSMKKLTDVIVHDIFSPPVASRIYAYPSIAAYEVLLQEHPGYISLAGQLKELEPLPLPEAELDYCYPLAATHAFLTVGKALIFSEEKIEAFEQQVYQEFRKMGMPSAVYERSLVYGKAVSQHILAWADQDNYKETRTFPKFSIKSGDPSRWQPTPPDYKEGIEPAWREIRTFVLDSSQQFVPLPPTPFSTDKSSKFFQEVMEVYTVVGEKAEDREERIEIAQFWDCNPFVSHHIGHVMFGTKKITPGGHWIGITSIACKQTKSDIMQTAEAYALVSIGLADAFISCWDEKYRSNLTRPETFINTYLDEDWLPVLQTPPFPEHTSGHSVISRAAAIVLTDLYGENFAFLDTVEVEYGLPARSFRSFIEASEEAAVSRLYGGIHYRPAIDYGVAQGGEVGRWLTAHVNTRK